AAGGAVLRRTLRGAIDRRVRAPRELRRQPAAAAGRTGAAGAGLLPPADPAGRARRPPRHRPRRARAGGTGDRAGMSLPRPAFSPPAWLRSPHVQSVLSSSPLRGMRARRRLARVAARHQPVVLEVGDGVRLQGVHSLPASGEPRALALLLHGWEGSVDSSYMRLT